jgi:hypothetical protein
MSDLPVWTAIGVAFATSSATFIKVLYDNKKNGNNNNSSKKPGTAKVCIERGESLAVIKSELKNYDKDFKEIKTSLKNIEDKI